MRKAAIHTITMTDFAFEEAAKRYHKTSFVHTFPGIVKTGFFKESGPLVRFGLNIVVAITSPWSIDITESGERHLHAATSGVYPARENDGGVGPGTESVKKGSDEEVGTGAYLVGSDGERKAVDSALRDLRSRGAGEKIWQHTLDVFRSVRG